MEPEDLCSLSPGLGGNAAKDSHPDSYLKMISHVLNRNKDIVSLILSYPPLNSLNRRRHEIWIQDVLKINEMVREMEMEVASVKKNIDALEVASQITRLLDHTWDDLEAYVPREFIDKMCKKNLEVDMSLWDLTMRPSSSRSNEQEAIPPTMYQDEIEREMTAIAASHNAKISVHDKLLNLVVDFALRQILQEIENPNLLRIGISGHGSLKILSTLMNLPKIRGIFDVVVQVNGLLHTTTASIEGNIAAQLGLSALTGLELDELLKGTNFLILLENIHERLELYQLGINWWNSKKIQKIVSLTRFPAVHQRMLLDLEISMDDHLVSWELFCLNVGNVVHSSVIQRLAIQAVRQCRGHLLATVLLARALKEVSEVQIWEYASYALALQPTTQLKDEVLFNTLAFLCGCLGNSERNCLRYFVEMESGVKLEKVNLIGRWIAGGLIGKLDEGEKIVSNLVDVFFLESSWNEDSVFIQMRGEIHEVLHNLLGLEKELLFLWLGGNELTEPPNVGAWEKATEVHLMNNKLFELPKNPFCPQLRALFLQINHHLRVVPTGFFEHMPVLQILDLSHTRIRSLPQSLFKLVKLKILLLRGCPLLMEIPPGIGELSNLEVLDLDGTKIISLPMNVGQLVNLKSLKVSFHGCNNRNRKNNQSITMIPQNVIAKLHRLEELCIYVSPEDERWSAIVKDIVKEVCSFQRLETVKLYLPEVILLNDFMVNRTSSINFSSLSFKFIVGAHSKRFISRLPHAVAVKFEQQERCLMYVNGKGVPIEIKEVLRYATALHLDRHLTLTRLSEFGIGNIRNLEFCVLGECSEIESIVDGVEIYTGGDEGGDAHTEVILGSLKYLRVHYMKNLQSILKGPIQQNCLSNLKSLELHACPNLSSILNLDLLENLNILEELVVERCPEIVSIVTHEIPENKQVSFVAYLPKLKKLSLHYMPKLVSISSGLSIGPTLEWMSFYNCPSLQTLSDREVPSNNLRVLVGETDWWRGLMWCQSTSQNVWPCNLDSIFIPIKQDIDLMTQLAEISSQLLASKQEREPSQLSVTGSDDTVKALIVEAKTTSEVKQLYEPEPAPLSPFSSEEGGSIEALVVETGTTSKESQVYEPVSLSLPIESSGSMKAPEIEEGCTSEEKHLCEATPLPFPREGGDSIQANEVEAETTLKKSQSCVPAKSKKKKAQAVLLNSSIGEFMNIVKQMTFGCSGGLEKYVRKDRNDQNSTSSKVPLSTVSATPQCKDDTLQHSILKKFTFAELTVATRNFHAGNLLGQGGFGSVFKGWIDENTFSATKPGTGMVIAVKRCGQASAQGRQEWSTETDYLGWFSHPHIVKLIGYCSEDEHLLLVYEFMQRGSLDNHLYKSFENGPLSWDLRMKIALGAAKGLAFLHGAEVNVIHRGIKTRNILLDSDYNAKLCGFRHAKDGPTRDESHVSTRVIGTIGYLDPYYAMTGHLTAKSDVYSFGVVLLELLCGRGANDWPQDNNEPSLIAWAKLCLDSKSKVFHIMDPRLEDQYSQKEARKVASLVSQCLSTNTNLRPSMAEVVVALEQLQDWDQPQGPKSTKSSGVRGSSKMSLSTVSATPRCKGDTLQHSILKKFTFVELTVATRSFHAGNLLGQGGFGSVFKGWIDENTFSAAKPGTGMVIAVKRHSPGATQGHQEWSTEIYYLERFSHPHIVKLIGYCSEDEHLLLVYEFMQRGSLDNHLYKSFENSTLSWHLRMKIALGAAKGLAFLHGAAVNVIHRGIKTRTVLLDSDYNAKLCGFGHAKDGPTYDESHVSTGIIGTYGYVDPEYLMTGHLTAKSDVYSFGVVMLELLCGRGVNDWPRNNNEPSLIEWAKLRLDSKSKIFSIMDPRLEDRYSQKGARKVASLVSQCLSTNPNLRPSMAEVVVALEQLQDWDQPGGPKSTKSSGVLGKDRNDRTSSKMSLSSVPATPRCKGDILRAPILKQFTFAELTVATGNFHADSLLGQGGSGSVFKGSIDEHSFDAAKPGIGMVIAVKRHSPGTTGGHQEWSTEISYLERFSHPHIVKLLGYCSEGEHRLLVYEFMQRGSLYNHLHNKSEGSTISWRLRMKIALGAAKGLAFLHGAVVNVIHRDIKTRTVLLDSDYNAKLSSFELAKVGPTCYESHVSTRVVGTPGYLDPEYLKTGHLTAKSDVYSFGVVLLELLSGRRAIDRSRPDAELYILQWAQPYLDSEHKILSIIDPRLKDQYSVEGARRVATLVSRCVSLDLEVRPSMAEVVATLERLQDWEPPPQDPNTIKSSGVKPSAGYELQDWESTASKSSGVKSSAGYEL